jgi:hypothetical protein
VLRTSITGDEPLICDTSKKGLDRKVRVSGFGCGLPEAGILMIHITWDNHHSLRLRLRTPEGAAEHNLLSVAHGPEDEDQRWRRLRD